MVARRFSSNLEKLVEEIRRDRDSLLGRRMNCHPNAGQADSGAIGV